MVGEVSNGGTIVTIQEATLTISELATVVKAAAILRKQGIEPSDAVTNVIVVNINSVDVTSQQDVEVLRGIADDLTDLNAFEMKAADLRNIADRHERIFAAAEAEVTERQDEAISTLRNFQAISNPSSGEIFAAVISLFDLPPDTQVEIVRNTLSRCKEIINARGLTSGESLSISGLLMLASSRHSHYLFGSKDYADKAVSDIVDFAAVNGDDVFAVLVAAAGLAMSTAAESVDWLSCCETVGHKLHLMTDEHRRMLIALTDHIEKVAPELASLLSEIVGSSSELVGSESKALGPNWFPREDDVAWHLSP